MSQAFRSVVVLVVFSLCLLITRNLAVSCIVMAVAAIATFLVLTFPLAMFETPKSKRWNFGSIVELFKQCFPLFIALFLYAFIDNMPKFVMEGVLSYDNQLYFNALYFPAQGILLTVGSSTSPCSCAWRTSGRSDETQAVRPDHRRNHGRHRRGCRRHDARDGMDRIPVMSFLYGVDFEQFRGLCYIMLAAGGVTAAIDFLYQ